MANVKLPYLQYKFKKLSNIQIYIKQEFII